MKDVPRTFQLEKMKSVCAIMDLSFEGIANFRSYELVPWSPERRWFTKQTWNSLSRPSRILLVKNVDVKVSHKSRDKWVKVMLDDGEPSVAVSDLDGEERYQEDDE